MTEPSFEQQLLEGIAADLDGNPDATVPLAYDYGVPGVVYAESATSIHIDRYPQKAGGSVTITDYTVTDDPSLSDSVVGIQFTIKHRDRNAVKAIAGDIFNRFHGRGRGMLGAVTLVTSSRASGTNTGQDGNERQGRIENYYLTVHRPSANRL